MRETIAITILSLMAAAGAGAQTVTLDEGMFRVLVDGIEVGTETFFIRQNGSGADATIVAKGNTVINSDSGARGLEAYLQIAGTTLQPAAYDVSVEGGDKITGRFVGRRVTAKTVSQTAENVREYLVSEGAILLDETVAHQHYFLARRVPEGGSRVPIVTPRESRQVFAEVIAEPGVTITVAGQRMTATRFRVVPASGDERVFWADESGRVLRLEIPARKLVVERTALTG